ncbi:unnamed protein product, partial [marine sediment metagenome]
MLLVQNEEGILSCETDSPVVTEVIETFRSTGYQEFELEDIFNFETHVHIQATDGITSGGTRICTVKTDSGESIQITLGAQTKEEGGVAKYYRGVFFLTSGATLQPNLHLHFDAHERAELQCDINLLDDVFAITEIWAGERPPPPESYIKVFASSLYSIEKY